MREKIIDFLKREIIGPDPSPPHIQNNGEEFLVEPPKLRYGAGILFPIGVNVSQIESNAENEKKVIENQVIEEIVDDNDENITQLDSPATSEEPETSEETINLANAFLQSAIGFSCFLDIPSDGFLIKIKAGRYRIGEQNIPNKEGKPELKRGYLREPINIELKISSSDLPIKTKRTCIYDVIREEKDRKLALYIKNRTSNKNFGNKNQLFTFTLVNESKGNENVMSSEACFFQVEFSVKSINEVPCFIPYPLKNNSSLHDDDLSSKLLYRNHKTYAIGHGCSANWKEAEGFKSIEISTDLIPVYEMKPIIPRKFDDLHLKMYDFSDLGNLNIAIDTLNRLCERYKEWIYKQEKIINNTLDEEFKIIAFKHIENCKKCCDRMFEGVKLIENNKQVQRAFTLMNHSMLLQQLRYGIKLRKWNISDDRDKTLCINDIKIPDINDCKTWTDWSEKNQNNSKYGTWYPFQIAFILMNLKSMNDPTCEQRDLVELIWFPTGGGKTEAYLGLTAFTIFISRIKNTDLSGTMAIMRYTLRLLTAQQFQRAASMICACDIIRRANENELGRNRITIGLWVGNNLTPNTRSEAVRLFKIMTQGKKSDNPFIILKCPWCGAQMGFVDNDPKNRLKGYNSIRKPSNIIFQCGNSKCDFSSEEFNLPLTVIDEDIYETPPTLLIGTVDKFAMLPWLPNAKNIFGFRGNERISPPSLIIQDELHLISGPLGSMVGHYETLISELCTIIDKERSIYPKIVTSTATISRAAEQCHALYNCGKDKVNLFPPQCLSAGDSFFAYEDVNSKGRIYVGVNAGSLTHQSAQIRVVSSLLQGVKSSETNDESVRDFYWTLVCYYNSLRELGQAATFINADIREYLNAMWIRKRIHKSEKGDPRRFINNHIELTSRIPSNNIPAYLQELEKNYSIDIMNFPVDICLATNMISVGVDVPRLGLMAVIGQPKTTSEYIQATSRVGRSKNGPGIVVSIYNPAKPRDRSHYEHFRSYHSTIYSQVEPTSITPFSVAVRERALHALLVGYVRFFGEEANRNSPQPLPSSNVLEAFKTIIDKRVDGIDPEEKQLTLKLLEDRIREWENYLPPLYGGFSFDRSDMQMPLMYPAGTTPNEEWIETSWSTPTSMRNVDASCEASIIGQYTDQGE